MPKLIQPLTTMEGDLFENFDFKESDESVPEPPATTQHDGHAENSTCICTCACTARHRRLADIEAELKVIVV